MNFRTIVKALTLIILNTIGAYISARWIYGITKGTQASISSADQPYFFTSAALAAFIGSLILIRWTLRVSLKENKVGRWVGVCFLNIGVVLIAHIGAGTVLALRGFWEYHLYMTTHSETYVFDLWAGPLTGIIITVGASIVLFGIYTIPFGLSVAVVWLLLYRNTARKLEVN